MVTVMIVTEIYYNNNKKSKYKNIFENKTATLISDIYNIHKLCP